MPGLAGQVVLPPPPTPPPPSLDVEEWTFIDAAGTHWPLTRRGVGYWVLHGTVTGLGVTPRVVTRDDRARGGTVTRHEWISGRLITFDMFVRGRTRAELLARWRPLGLALLGGGVLRIAQADGTVREIDVELEPGSYDNHPERIGRHEQPTVQLWCPRGYFRDVDPVVIERTQRPRRRFLAPFMSVSSSRIPGREVLRNDGDADAWPEVELRGPFAGFTAINHTLGETWTLDPGWDGGGPLAAGEVVRITSDPPTVTGPAGQVWWGALTGDPWPLVKGDNDIEIVLSGVGPGAGVTFTYQRLREIP
ncbi:hypothetical protein [Micromonospora yangpuensis]|uniref:Phage tail protein n=1 Tax=Micromonospora yangpuensis TaxID=683228 RepID=A0A1C6VE41_9ACTN|nr:hypothetical protein [Micromonospora yangpuensis]GGM14366.1 hypothetical protein GCM10012279_35570 [Micromonospora yangpuensis]SCL64606.1 hypothetical protein GA0070617_5513 [Micromonospora yangpuensis]